MEQVYFIWRTIFFGCCLAPTTLFLAHTHQTYGLGPYPSTHDVPTWEVAFISFSVPDRHRSVHQSWKKTQGWGGPTCQVETKIVIFTKQHCYATGILFCQTHSGRSTWTFKKALPFSTQWLPIDNLWFGPVNGYLNDGCCCILLSSMGYLLSTIFVHTVPVFVGGFRGPLHPSLIKDPVCTSNQLNFDPLVSYFALGPRLASYLHADAFTCRPPEFSPSPQRMCSIDHARSGMMFKVLPLPWCSMPHSWNTNIPLNPPRSKHHHSLRPTHFLRSLTILARPSTPVRFSHFGLLDHAMRRAQYFCVWIVLFLVSWFS